MAGPYPDHKYVVCTGSEIAIETNGTLPVPDGVDWVCVSPKMGSSLVVRRGNEIKVVIPQAGQPMEEYATLPFEHHFVQAMDGPRSRQPISAWRLTTARPIHSGS